MSLLHSKGASVYGNFVVCLIAFFFDFFFELLSLLHECTSHNQFVLIFSMHKTLVIFDLDQNVVWSIAYVSEMKSTFVLAKFDSKIKSQNVFENLKIWVFTRLMWVIQFYTEFFIMIKLDRSGT